MENKTFKHSISRTHNCRYTIYAFLALAIINFCFIGCNNQIMESPFYFVSFETDGGIPVPERQEVLAGETITAPSSNPTKAGYVFMFWHLPEESTAYNFQTPVYSDLTLVAQWEVEWTAESEEALLSVSPNSPITFTPVGGAGETKTINVTTNQSSWNAVSNQAWCTVTKSANQFTVTASANLAAGERMAIITVSAGNAPHVTIEVTQAGLAGGAELTVDPNRISLGSWSDGYKVAVKTNQPSWNATSNCTWCTLDIKNEGNIGTLTVSVEANSAAVSREATITITAGNANPQTISVFQAGAGAQLSLSLNNVELNRGGDTKTVTVTTNQSSWNVVSNQEWLTVSKSGNTITLSAPALTGATRSATVTVTAVHALPQSIYVTQKAPDPNIAFVAGNPAIEYLYTMSGFFNGSRLNFNLVVYDDAGRTSITITEEATGAPNGNRKTVTQTRVIPISGPGTYPLSQSIMSSESYANTYSQFTYTVSAHGKSYSRTYSGLYNSLNGAWGHYFVSK